MAAVVMHAEIWMVVFAVRNEGEGVHECHGFIVIVEMEGFTDGLTVFKALQWRCARVSRIDMGYSPVVHASLACNAVKLRHDYYFRHCPIPFPSSARQPG